jgi:hypothetical protein
MSGHVRPPCFKVQGATSGCFIHSSITTPIASALKNGKLFYLELFRTFNGNFKALLDLSGIFIFIFLPAARRFQN